MIWLVVKHIDVIWFIVHIPVDYLTPLEKNLREHNFTVDNLSLPTAYL